MWYPEKIPLKKSLNFVEREPVETRVLNLNASEASYKPKQRSYKKKNSGGIWSGGFYPGTLLFMVKILLEC